MTYPGDPTRREPEQQPSWPAYEPGPVSPEPTPPAPRYEARPAYPVTYTHPAAAQGTNGIGLAGFVVGLIALVLSFVPIIGIASWVLAPIGAALSGAGLGRQPRGLATAGIVCSSVALVICFLWVMLLAS